jgi:hypothetical protein
MSEHDEIKQVVDEARSSYGLIDRLKKRDMRTSKVTVFTDEVTGVKHLSLTQQIDKLAAAKDRSPEDDELLLNLERKKVDLERELKQSSFTIHLQAVPPVVARDGLRIARKTLGIKGEVPADRIDEVNEVSAAALLSKAVTKWVDNSDGSEHNELTLEEARALKDYLPLFESLRLNAAVDDLQYRNVIAQSVTSDSDF